MQPGSNSVDVDSAFLGRLLAAVCVTLAGCGTAVLKESRPLESSGVVAEAKDARILASIETVILRNGPGAPRAWVRDAEWDEYLIRIRALSDEPVEVREIAIFDALDQRIEARKDRAALVDGTREIERRYAQSGKLVRKDGVNVSVVDAGVAGIAGLTVAAVSSSAAGIAGGVAAAAAPFAAVYFGGIFLLERTMNNAEADREIKRRQTAFPVTVPQGPGTTVHLFFPVTPLSGRTQVVYADRHGEHCLDIDTHGVSAVSMAAEEDPPPVLVTRYDPEFPDLAQSTGIDQGYVTARLELDRLGRVHDVTFIETVPLYVFNEAARQAFFRWTYTASRQDGRTVEARLEFKR